MRARLHVALTSVAGSDTWDEIEVPDEEWATLDEDDRESMMDECLKDHISNYVNSWWEEVPE